MILGFLTGREIEAEWVRFLKRHLPYRVFVGG
jgi:hypothetical protein